MERERRMLLAHAMLVIAQQEVKNVKWLNVRPSRVKRLSEMISEESRSYVASEGFAELCETLDIDVEAFRHLDPDRALENYNRIIEGKDL